MENFKIIKRKGGTILLWGGRQFYKQKLYKNGSSIWKCRNGKKHKCRGSVTIKGEKVIKNTSHTCMEDYGKNIVDEAIEKMKVESRLTDTPIPQIYKKAKDKLQADGIQFVASIPKLKNIQTTLYTQRNRTNYKEVHEVAIPLAHSEFMLCDYSFENCRIIVFCSSTNRNMLNEINEFFMDGTFQSCPGPFSQIYTIHGDVSNSAAETHVIPLVYALMTHKDQKSYYALFEMIKVQTSWNPKKVHIDFEIAAANALVECFPETQIKRCFYHYTKALWKKGKEMKITSKRERRIIGLFTALPLLPMTHIQDGVAYIREESPKTDKINKFFKYMERTWLKNHQFISQWSVYGERHRTNNVVESWHAQLNKDVKKRCPKSLLRLLNILREKEDDDSEASPRRQEFIQQDDYILKSQLELIHGEISLGHFLEKTR